jgi:hypothetical protein
MATNIISRYQKIGAVFPTAEEALANKKSMETPELRESIDACTQSMLNAGILLGPYTFTWDPVECILGIVKPVSTYQAYYDNKTFDGATVVAQAAQAGWTYLGDGQIPIE